MKKIIAFLFIFHISSFLSSSIAQQWNAVGSGLNGSVYAFAVYNNELYAGGDFMTNGDGDTVRGIAKWNGSKWIAIGDTLSGGAYTLCVYNNKLYAGTGSINNAITRWDGTKWESMGISATIYTLTVYDNELYAGGDFDSAGSLRVNKIARWNDTVWRELNSTSVYGNGVSGYMVEPYVNSLAVYNSQLIVGGEFHFNVMTSGWRQGIAVWDGNILDTLYNSSGGSTAFAVYHNLLYGESQSMGVPFQGWRISRYNGMVWDSCGSGINDFPNVLYVYNDALYAGGDFDTAGGIKVSNIAKWNDTVWNDVGGGTNGSVYAMIEFDSSLFIGGLFDTAGGVAVNNVARWGKLTGINERSLVNGHLPVVVYPNPANVQINIRIENGKSASIELYDVMGKKVLHQSILSSAQISLSGLPPGIYFYRLTDKEKNIARGKVVKQ